MEKTAIREGQMTFAVALAEMKLHLEARAAHHEKRAAELDAEADAAEKEAIAALGSAETVTDRLSLKNSSVYTGPLGQRDRLRDDAIKHARKSKDFAFYAAHLTPALDTHFYLTRAELSQLELTSPGTSY